MIKEALVILRDMETYTQQVYRLQATPEVARTAELLVKLRAVEAGWEIPVGLPVEGTDAVKSVLLSVDEAKDLASQAEPRLTELCEGSREAADFIYCQAGYQLDIELGLATAPLQHS